MDLKLTEFHTEKTHYVRVQDAPSPSNKRNLVGPVVEGSREEDLLAISSPAKDCWSV